MRQLKIKDAINKAGDSSNDYTIYLYNTNSGKDPIKLDENVNYQVKIGNKMGFLKSISCHVNDDKDGLILLASELSELPSDTYYIEVWFKKDGLTYIYPSKHQAKIELTHNIEETNGKTLPVITIEELKKELADNATGGKGDTGKDGKSAYQIWLDNGNQGTEQDFLTSLKGKDGDVADVQALEKMSIDIPSFEVEYSRLGPDHQQVETDTQKIDASEILLQKDNDKYKFLLDENTFLGQLIQATVPLIIKQNSLDEVIQEIPEILKFINTDFYEKVPSMIESDSLIKLLQQRIDKLEKQIAELNKSNT